MDVEFKMDNSTENRFGDLRPPFPLRPPPLFRSIGLSGLWASLPPHRRLRYSLNRSRTVLPANRHHAEPSDTCTFTDLKVKNLSQTEEISLKLCWCIFRGCNKTWRDLWFSECIQVRHMLCGVKMFSNPSQAAGWKASFTSECICDNQRKKHRKASPTVDFVSVVRESCCQRGTAKREKEEIPGRVGR